MGFESPPLLQGQLASQTRALSYGNVLCSGPEIISQNTNPLLYGIAVGYEKTRMSSSLGRGVFGSEISYNKAPPLLPGLACLIAQSRKKSWDIEFQKVDGP